MIKKLNPLFDLDGTLIREDRGSKRLFDFLKPDAILNLTEQDLTPLGELVRDSSKEFDILTARGPENAKFIRIAKFVKRKLVDNDERNLVGLGELGELVSQDQTEF